MSTASIFGGGFFYQPFANTSIARVAVACPAGGLGVYGAWQTIVPISWRARWMHVSFYLPAAAGQFAVQFGLGAAGAEILWQPSIAIGASDGFYCFVPAGPLEPIQVYSFPISLQPNVRLSVRGSTTVGGGSVVNTIVGLWG